MSKYYVYIEFWGKKLKIQIECENELMVEDILKNKITIHKIEKGANPEPNFIVYFEFYGKKLKTKAAAASINEAVVNVKNKLEVIKIERIKELEIETLLEQPKIEIDCNTYYSMFNKRSRKFCILVIGDLTNYGYKTLELDINAHSWEISNVDNILTYEEIIESYDITTKGKDYSNMIFKNNSSDGRSFWLSPYGHIVILKRKLFERETQIKLYNSIGVRI